MAKDSKNIDLVERPIEAVEETLSKAETLFHTYQKQLTYAVGGIIAVVALVWGYQEFIVKPAEEEAQLELYAAQDVFSQDSLRLALNGNAEFMGFFNLSGRAVSTLGPMLFATILHVTGSAHQAILSLLVFFVVGWTFICFVNLSRGQQQAAEDRAV
jgi:hypothetical protein